MGGPAPAAPHGGILVQRVVEDRDERQELERRAAELPAVFLDAATAYDLELLAVGAYSPLCGFMTRDEYEAVLEEMHLPSGWPWTLPILLRVPPDEARALRPDAEVALRDGDGRLLGVMRVADAFRYDREREARRVFGTADPEHPGVQALAACPAAALGGPVRLVHRPWHPLRERILDPADVRRELVRRGWTAVAAFQTRNPLHRGHEYLLRVALELVDGLLLHPLVGPTKADDLPADLRMRTYEAVVAAAFPEERVLLAGFPAAMRYAGPREAVFHALVRKNYGATHFIVGRNHAGVGRYYGPYDAQRLLARFDPARLGIVPLCFEDAFYCRGCGGMATAKTCRHGEADRLHPSGTDLRRALRDGSPPPVEWVRPEVARVLVAARGGPDA